MFLEQDPLSQAFCKHARNTGMFSVFGFSTYCKSLIDASATRRAFTGVHAQVFMPLRTCRKRCCLQRLFLRLACQDRQGRCKALTPTAEDAHKVWSECIALHLQPTKPQHDNSAKTHGFATVLAKIGLVCNQAKTRISPRRNAYFPKNVRIWCQRWCDIDGPKAEWRRLLRHFETPMNRDFPHTNPVCFCGPVWTSSEP